MDRVKYLVNRSKEVYKEEGVAELQKKINKYIYQSYVMHWKLISQTYLNHIINTIRYDSPPSPSESIYISPKNIGYRINSRQIGTPESEGLGVIRGGDWDSPEQRKNILSHPGIKAIIEHFNKGKPWHETERHNFLLKKYSESGEYKRLGYNSPEKYLEEVYEKYEDLFLKIKEEGYQENHQGKRQTPGGFTKARDRLEVLVTIGKTGEIYFWDGHHRFAIAYVLNIDIPVQVFCRHHEWQELRDKISKNGFSDKNSGLKEHPDLKDIV